MPDRCLCYMLAESNKPCSYCKQHSAGAKSKPIVTPEFDGEAVEVMRCWIVKDDVGAHSRMLIRPFFEEPKYWGRILAEALQHAVAIELDIAQREGRQRDPKDVIDEILAEFSATLDEPWSGVSTERVDENEAH